MRGFLGLTGFYSPYVRYYADLAAPLSDLLQAGKFDWRREHDDAFSPLKKALLQNVVLHIVDFHKPFFMRTDASKLAVGAVLEQHSSEGELRPVAFYSRKLTKAQKNWSTTEQEMYAVVTALMKWESLIGTQQVTVLTDHHSLQHWHSEHVTTPSGPTGRRARWHEVFSRFHLDVEYLPGTANSVADALSRWAYPGGALQYVLVHGSAADAALLDRSGALLDSVIAPVSTSSSNPVSVSSSTPNVFVKDWVAEYRSCSRWGTTFVDIVDNNKISPHFHWNGRRLYLNDRSCVPSLFVESMNVVILASK